MKYEYMIHKIAECYGQCKYDVADKYTETDFFEMQCFKNMESEQQNYLSKA